MSYHLCARQIGQCVGLGRGIKEYHLCARNANCKKMDREKVEKVVSKIKKREKDKQVESIGNFFEGVKNRVPQIKNLISHIQDYRRSMESANQPRIRKKTKDSYLKDANVHKNFSMNILNRPWYKKNYPNPNLDDKNLIKDLTKSYKKLQKFGEEQSQKTYNRNLRNDTIRKMIEDKQFVTQFREFLKTKKERKKQKKRARLNK
jgi:hypothetical protein